MAHSEDHKDIDHRHRTVALVGPYQSGKTSLLEALLARTGIIKRPGSTALGNSFGDSSPEARAHNMSVELNMAEAEFLGDKFTLLDCPGSIEFQYDAAMALTVCDAAIVVCEPDEKKIPALQLILKQLEDRNIPHFLFLNKMDKTEKRVRDILEQFKSVSSAPLVLRQIPIREDDAVTGFVDLALERAYVYRKHAASERIDMPDNVNDRKGEARFSMLEQLADYDDALMEQLLEDQEPDQDIVCADLAEDLRQGMICPVFLGSAENGYGIFRLLKALRHETPFIQDTLERLDIQTDIPCAQILKTLYAGQGGKLSIARILSGSFKDGDILHSRCGEERISGIHAYHGVNFEKVTEAGVGQTVAFGKLEQCVTGDTLCQSKGDVIKCQIDIPATPETVYQKAISVKDRKDEVKLSAALKKISEEDPSIILRHDQDLNQMTLAGQGEVHLRVAQEKLARKYGVQASIHPRQIPYKETIRKTIEIRGKHKKQSGGHGQYGDVVLEIKPVSRGEGFEFSDQITGGVVPKQYIPSVEAGVRDYLKQGPLGFPVIDVAVCLKDGSYHSVDSSDQAFKMAGRIAMTEGLVKCSPVLLEPIMQVEIVIPSDVTAKINGIISSRRGQILGFEARQNWPGWDKVKAYLPEVELQNLIVELRSASAGVGSYKARFCHLAELTGKLAENVLSGHVKAA